MIRTTCTLLTAAVLAAAAPSAHAAKDDLLLVSAPLAAPFALDGGSERPSVSRDGRFVAFQSAAMNLVPGDVNGKVDIFVKDLATGEVDLVSRSTTGMQADDNASWPSISADGRYVAFSSGADNLVAGVTSSSTGSHVFVRDRQQGTTIAADRTIAGTIGTGSATSASISANGRKVAFLSISHNLVAGVDEQSLVDAYVKDLDSGNIVLISRASGPSGTPSNGTTSEVRISADGTQAAFVTTASNLGTANSLEKVYRRGTVNDAPLVLVSRAAGANGAAADADAERPAISADGNVVAFQSAAENLSGLDTTGTTDVYTRSISATTVSLMSRANGFLGAAADDISFTPSISDDGNRVAFGTYSDNIGADDNDNGMNVYVRDRTANTTTYVSRASGAAGLPGGENSDQPAISGDGRWVAFRGQGDNLSDLDSDDYADIFSRDVLGGPPFVEPQEPPTPQEPTTPAAPGGPTGPGGGAGGPGGGTTAPGAGSAGASPAARLRLLGLRATRTRFKARRGTTVALRVSKPARVGLKLERATGQTVRSRPLALRVVR
jgi:Tol biopolymer transport system component